MTNIILPQLNPSGNSFLALGYMYLEDWRQAIDASRPVYACLVRLPAGGQSGMEYFHMRIVCAQHDAHGCIHYCRLDGGSLCFIGGAPFDPDHRERIRAAQSLWEQVSGWLEGEGLRIIEACYAFPIDWRFSEGEFAAVRYDRERRRWMLSDPAGCEEDSRG